jgi:hypothetical protein
LFSRGGYSSAGRALAWHARGQRFDPAYLHHVKENDIRQYRSSSKASVVNKSFSKSRVPIV